MTLSFWIVIRIEQKCSLESELFSIGVWPSLELFQQTLTCLIECGIIPESTDLLNSLYLDIKI